jgi:hypothetical protein
MRPLMEIWIMRFPLVLSRAGALAALAIGMCGVLASSPASAWWRGGVWIGLPPIVIAPGAPYYGPAYYPPPYYPYPPGYYYPPPAAYPATPVPPAQGQAQAQAQPARPQGPVTYGTICHAGVYSCAAPNATPVGQGCVCPGLGAPSYGVVN